MVVDVRHVLSRHCREMAAVGDQHLVQQFAADSSDLSFGDRFARGARAGVRRMRGSVAFTGLMQGGTMHRRLIRVPAPRSGFEGFRFPPDVIMVAVRWYLRYGISYRDVEELLAERGIEVDHWQLCRRITASEQAGLMRRRPARVPAPRSSFAGFRFPPEVITVAVRWYLRYGLSYRDVEELPTERGITVDQLMARSYTTGYGQRTASHAGQDSG
jgi:hypothetical protein